MYSDGKKVLFMCGDQTLTQKMETYFYNRYNLQLDRTSDALEVLGRIGSDDDTYELAILDENVVGLPTTSHLFKTIKDQDLGPSVMYLSTLHEIVNPIYRDELTILPRYSDEMFRMEQYNENIGLILSLWKPLFQCKTIKEVCEKGCRGLVENLQADYAVCVIPRFDEDPLSHATVAARYPDPIPKPYTIDLKGSRHFRELVDYYKPVHLPDLRTDKELCRELMEKFSLPCRSALIVPMAIAGKFLGYFALFTAETGRLYRLVEIDSALRLADFASAAAVHIFMADLKERGAI